MDEKIKKRRHTGTGVLVITNINNKPHLVLGRETFKSLQIKDDLIIEKCIRNNIELYMTGIRLFTH